MSSKNYNLKIERENGTFDEINFSFRLNNLDEEIAFAIKNILTGIDFTFNKKRKDNRYVILFDNISPTFDIDLIIRVIKDFNLEEDDYGLWISINSEYGHGGGFIPKEIREFYKKTGGQIDFSYLIGEQ